MEDTTMKKTYINPEVEVIKLASQMQILNGSGVLTGGVPGEEYTDTDVSFGREEDFDFDNF
jgi:hypothetical protein